MLTVLKGADVPPFQTTAITFGLGGGLLLLIALARGRAHALHTTPAAFGLGLYGLFGYHALYFAALRLAPAAEASLIASLWALLTVLLSGLLPGQRLRPRHVLGAMLGLAAAAILVNGGDTAVRQAMPTRAWGFVLAFACAFVWASYSVLSRLAAAIPSESLAVPCLTTSVLAAACAMAFEPWIWPADGLAWAALVLLGLGPVGGAFVLWDIGMKRGNIQQLGVLAYAAPVISTILLVASGLARPTISLAVACVLMLAAAALVVRRA